MGIDLVRKAFAVGERPDPLTDTALPPGELEAMMDFFTGAIGTFKNVIGHRYVNLQDPQQARDTLDLASLLLTMLSCRDTVAF